MVDKFHHTAVKHFTDHYESKSQGARLVSMRNPNAPSMTSIMAHIKEKTKIPFANLHNHLLAKAEAGEGADEGGSGISGGSIHMGGSFAEQDIPDSPSEMYAFILHMNPYQIELLRETAAQLLGGVRSPFFGNIAKGDETLEAPAEDYEHIIRMPNAHAIGRMIEADHGATKGGGFGSALKHVGRVAGKWYRAARGALKIVSHNKENIMNLLPEDYKSVGTAAFGAVDTLTQIDNAINPLVDAAIDAAQDTATPEQKQKLKQLAEKSIDKAVAQHLPKAQPYYAAAKQARDQYQSYRAGASGAARKPVLQEEEAVTGL